MCNVVQHVILTAQHLMSMPFECHVEYTEKNRLRLENSNSPIAPFVPPRPGINLSTRNKCWCTQVIAFSTKYKLSIRYKHKSNRQTTS